MSGLLILAQTVTVAMPNADIAGTSSRMDTPALALAVAFCAPHRGDEGSGSLSLTRAFARGGHGSTAGVVALPSLPKAVVGR